MNVALLSVERKPGEGEGNLMITSRDAQRMSDCLSARSLDWIFNDVYEIISDGIVQHAHP